MRNHLLSGAVTLVLIAACGASAASVSTSTGTSSPCVSANAPHRAYVVVEHHSGATMQNCVGFSGDFIDGQTLMDRSGFQYEAQGITSARVVCQIDFEPKQLSQCVPANQAYWALFIESGGRWTNAPGGLNAVRLQDKEAIGWHYVGATDRPPAPPPLAKKA